MFLLHDDNLPMCLISLHVQEYYFYVKYTLASNKQKIKLF